MNRVPVRGGGWPVLFVVLAALAGCGEAPAPGRSEADQVSALVDSFGDAASANALKKRFAKGAAPTSEQTRKYATFNYTAVAPVIDGDTARVRVTLRDLKDREVGEVEWTCVREGDAWKIQKAPLP